MAKTTKLEIEYTSEQPDPVCGCGKTSEGTCPRCGQRMTESEVKGVDEAEERFRKYRERGGKIKPCGA